MARVRLGFDAPRSVGDGESYDDALSMDRWVEAARLIRFAIHQGHTKATSCWSSFTTRVAVDVDGVRDAHLLELHLKPLDRALCASFTVRVLLLWSW